MESGSNVFSKSTMNQIQDQFLRIQDKCYVDNVGAALYAKCQIDAMAGDLLQNVYSNPHSDKFTSDCIDQIRYMTLRHFNTDPSEYSIIFTSGSTASLKLISETFEYNHQNENGSGSGAFIYSIDNHTSVLGMREVAQQKKADLIPISHKQIFNQMDNDTGVLYKNFENCNTGNALFAYSAQSNFNGFKYPLKWIQNIQTATLNPYTKSYSGKSYNNWFVMLDAASYVSTNKLDLSLYKPDFLCISFYKMFGFPTGVGALIVKNSSIPVLNQKAYFGGGSVDIVLSEENYHVKRNSIHERFEDGTISFLSILAIKYGFDAVNKLIPKIIKNDVMETISLHTFNLAKEFYLKLKELKHSNGQPIAIIYADSDFTDTTTQGGIVNFNLVRSDGRYIGYSEVYHMAELFNINLRVGCFCNSGTCQRHLCLTSVELKAMYNAGHKCGDDYDLIHGKPTGSVRVSFGYYNTREDVNKIIVMLKRCFINNKMSYELEEIVVNGDKLDDKLMYNNKISKTVFDRYNRLSIDKGNKIIKEWPNKSNTYLRAICIYPIKSCAAYKAYDCWDISSRGFLYDREWMIVKDNGVALTQKQSTAMCMIRPTFNFQRMEIALHFPGKPSIMLPLNREVQTAKIDTTLCQSKVCGDKISGYDCGEAAGQWISEALEISGLRLIRQTEDDGRTLKTKDITKHEKLLSFSNKSQFLLINVASVKWLSHQVADTMCSDNLDNLIDRFRANLIVDTKEKFTEKSWKTIMIGKHLFKVEGPCTRCQMICIDQQTGLKTVEPLRTISEVFSGKLHFGMYLTYLGHEENEPQQILKCNMSVQTDDVDF